MFHNISYQLLGSREQGAGSREQGVGERSILNFLYPLNKFSGITINVVPSRLTT
ncbi:MAG: hypothetical protein ACRC32_02320 [Chroococcidiopsis sp.]